MQISDVRAYEGKEPFIFVSYAHKDSARVLPILAQLQSRGYRVWYDEGIAPGSEWPENIAQHLNDCAVTVAFVSNNSMASPNCRREITYALSKKKPFLGIFLEQAEMSPGMELQMSSQQCVMKFSYRSEEMFYDKVCSCPDLAPCKKPEPVPVVASPVVPTPQTKAPATPARNNVLKQKPWLWAVAGGALVAIILVIVLLAGGNDPAGPSGTDGKNLGIQTTGSTSSTTQTPPTTTKPNETEPSQPTQPEQTVPSGPAQTDPTEPEDDDSPTVTIFPDKVVDKTEDYLYLNGYTITADTVRQINKLKDLRTLELQECTIEANALDQLSGYETLRYLTLQNCAGIADFHFLAKFPNIKKLYLPSCGVTDAGLPNLTATDLECLDLSGNQGFTDLSAISQLSNLYTLEIASTGVTTLTGLPQSDLYGIDFSYTSVNNISVLADYENLAEVYGVQTSVNDISPLAKLENLTVLAFSDSLLSQITTPLYSLYLSELYLGNCGLSDISGLTHLTQLEILDLSENTLSDISFIQKSSAKLEYLDISNLPLTDETDLSFLSDCTNLVGLYIGNMPLKNLDFCNSLTNLTELYATNCSLTSISGLANCTKLKYIYLSQNQITDISALSGLTEYYVTLDLGYNDLTDVSALADVFYRTLCLVANEHLDMTTVTVSGNTLLTSYMPNLETDLAKNFYYYGIVDCPLDRIIAVKDAFGSYAVTILNSKEEFLTFAASKDLYYT